MIRLPQSSPLFPYTTLFRSVPNGPKVARGGALSPRGEWRAPSGVGATAGLAGPDPGAPRWAGAGPPHPAPPHPAPTHRAPTPPGPGAPRHFPRLEAPENSRHAPGAHAPGTHPPGTHPPGTRVSEALSAHGGTRELPPSTKSASDVRAAAGTPVVRLT